MDTEDFRIRGKEMVDYICNYMDTMKDMRVTPTVEPGYMRRDMATSAPQEPEPWETIMEDVNTKIMPGMTHWSHPRFHAYFPAGNSYASLLGGMMCDAFGCVGFSWAASPACTELETIVMDWMAKAIGLPKEFMALEEGSKGGGVIQSSASECVLAVMLAARASAIKRLKQSHPTVDEGVLLSKLIAYCSKEAHSCVEKDAMIAFVRLRILSPDENNSLRGDTLKKAMEEDEEAGRVPFFVSCTLGTTSVCSFDAIEEIGRVCRRFPAVWMHVDAAYAGNSFICPELRHHLRGIEYADSFNTNANKWFMTHFDCSLLWVRNKLLHTSAMVVDPVYLQHAHDGTVIDYRHWGIPLSRRFRSLKLWFVIRMHGISGVQEYIRNHIRLAKYFESLVRSDSRFEICNQVELGLVCFRLNGYDGQSLEDVNNLNKKLITSINMSGKIHMVPASVKDKFILRFCVTAPKASKEDIEYAWEVICDFANELSEVSDKADVLSVSSALEKKRKETLAHKRSFFVRMVSDPKIYNPVITKSPSTSAQKLSPEGREKKSSLAATASLNNSLSSSGSNNSSWISWPLAFFFQSSDNENGGAPNDLPIRFRHLDTMVRLKSPVQMRRGSSPSPERDPSQSPRRLSPSTNTKKNSSNK